MCFLSVKKRSMEGLESTKLELMEREKVRQELQGVGVWLAAADGLLSEMEQSSSTQELQVRSTVHAGRISPALGDISIFLDLISCCQETLLLQRSQSETEMDPLSSVVYLSWSEDIYSVSSSTAERYRTSDPMNYWRF